VFEERDGEIAGAAADVEDSGVGIGKRGAKGKSGATPPEAIDVCGEDVVEEVVAGRNGVEHLLHGLSCAGLILHTQGLCAGGHHDLRASFACESM